MRRSVWVSYPADDRRVTLHFPAVEEERVYATDRAPSRLLLKPDQSADNEAVVESVRDQNGVLIYQAKDSTGNDVHCREELNAHIELNTPVERLLNNQLGKPRDFDIRRTTLEHAAAGEGFGMRGLLQRALPFSHQLYVAASVDQRFAPVLQPAKWSWKTIEAGLILTQQLQRHRANKILIIVPIRWRISG